MKLLRSFSIAAVATTLVAALAAPAEAAGLNDRRCKSPKPPVILVHGQGGNFEGMGAVTQALIGADNCVFAMNYGRETPNGLFGRAHLDQSANEIAGFIRAVMKDTGAKKVNVVGHSAGTGVLANYILLRGGAGEVANAVSFGGLHHPYAHLGLAKVIDANVFLPSAIGALQNLLPPFTSKIKLKDIVVGAFGLGSSVGLNLPPNERDLVASGFVSDLFDPNYWNRIHGGLSEPTGVLLSLNASQRSLKTRDSAPTVCYTNIVGVADFITGANAGFQDEAPNVENFVLTSFADHSTMLADPVAIQKMLAGINKNCSAPAVADTPPGEGGIFH